MRNILLIYYSCIFIGNYVLFTFAQEFAVLLKPFVHLNTEVGFTFNICESVEIVKVK